jgi:hypothetical protein
MKNRIVKEITGMDRVTDHTYCYGCDDKYSLVLPTVPNPTDLWESHSVPHSNSTKINHSTSRLIFLLNYTGTTLHVPTVEPSTRFRSTTSLIGLDQNDVILIFCFKWYE